MYAAQPVGVGITWCPSWHMLEREDFVMSHKRKQCKTGLYVLQRKTHGSWMDEWKKEQPNEQMRAWMSEQINEQMDKWLTNQNEWLNEQMHGRWSATAGSRAHLSVNHVDLRAVVVVDASKLQANVAASNDCQLLGQAGQIQDLIWDDGMLCTINGQLHCSAACCYQNSLCLQQ